MRYSIRINPKFFKRFRRKLKENPSKIKNEASIFLLIFFLIGISLSMLFTSLENLVEIPIEIEEVELTKTYSIRGSPYKLEIMANNHTYELWYPRHHYHDYIELVSSDLLSGEVTSVVALAPKQQSIHDKLTNRTEIVDLRSNRNVYYSVETEKKVQKIPRIGLTFIILPTFILFLIVWFVLCNPIHGLFIISKKKPKPKPKK